MNTKIYSLNFCIHTKCEKNEPEKLLILKHFTQLQFDGIDVIKFVAMLWFGFKMLRNF